MDDAELDAAHAHLLDDLDAAVELLEAHGERHWSAWLRTARTRIAAVDTRGLDHLLGAYGGMGSFNDVRLSEPHPQGRPTQFAQALLDELRSTMFTAATGLRRARR